MDHSVRARQPVGIHHPRADRAAIDSVSRSHPCACVGDCLATRTVPRIVRESSMWRADTLWFDVAVVMTIFAVGGILFGRFEQHKPRWRRVLKVVVVLAVILVL